MLIKERKIWTPDNSYLLEYYTRIECGEIIVGQELWQELKNLKEDTMYAASLMVSNYSTQLIRIFSPTCKDVLSDDVMLPYLTKPYASRPVGKIVLNDDNTKKYYIYNNLAVKYTD